MQTDLLKLCAGGGRTILFVTPRPRRGPPGGLADRVIVPSAGPHSRICGLEEVGIPRPRDLLAVRGLPRFGQLSELLWRRLYEEIRRAYGRIG